MYTCMIYLFYRICIFCQEKPYASNHMIGVYDDDDDDDDDDDVDTGSVGIMYVANIKQLNTVNKFFKHQYDKLISTNIQA